MLNDSGARSGVNALWSIVAESVTRADLEAHLALLVLDSGTPAANPTVVSRPWDQALSSVVASPLPAAPMRRPQDVATLGIRLALGHETERAGEFKEDARREVARAPMPPVASLRDDDRVLIGISAGLGKVGSSATSDVLAILRQRERGCPLRQACLGVFAEALLTGSRVLDATLSERGYHILVAPPTSRPAQGDRDRVAVYWLATRLLDSDWHPTDEQVGLLGRVLDEGGRAARLMLAGQYWLLDPLDAAMLLDAMSAAPATRLARASGLDAVLTIVDRFAASSSVLANRQRDRTGIRIQDEYDVQDLFHALVLPAVPDIVPEDPAPKIAGKASRLDFTSKSLRLGVELKHVRSAAHGRAVRDELLVDSATYQAHPYVDTVVAFVHDPECHIPLSERPAFESDLSVTVGVGHRTVRYIVRVR